MRLDDFDYTLPEELVAQEPLAERDASRLLVLGRRTGATDHRLFRDLPEYLRPGDLLVLNDAKVVPARLVGRKAETGGRVEMLLSMPLGAPDGGRWRCIGQASKAIRPGARLDFDGLLAEVLEARGQGVYDLRFDTADLFAALERVGRVPLPPYIRRKASDEDRERYQTVFAQRPGAVAAPTAGFHFTRALLDRVREMGVEVARVTLYVGAGTFLPVRTPVVEEHRMHAERFQVPEETAIAVAAVRARGGRVVAVGTTAARTLESASSELGVVAPGDGVSELYVYPGYRFRVVDALVTNFHLPRSTLLLMVSALAGREPVLAAYREAVERRYRFFSYGDAMLIA